MRRYQIRNLDSPRTVKPRVFDIVMEEDEAYIEVKQSHNQCERVKLSSVISQMREACPKELRADGLIGPDQDKRIF